MLNNPNFNNTTVKEVVHTQNNHKNNKNIFSLKSFKQISVINNSIRAKIPRKTIFSFVSLLLTYMLLFSLIHVFNTTSLFTLGNTPEPVNNQEELEATITNGHTLITLTTNIHLNVGNTLTILNYKIITLTNTANDNGDTGPGSIISANN